MQPIVKDTKKDAARPAHPDTTSTATGEDSRLNKMANQMAGRGKERQRKDEEGKDVIVESDPHGSR
jgi:hypothetical protein